MIIIIIIIIIIMIIIIIITTIIMGISRALSAPQNALQLDKSVEYIKKKKKKPAAREK